MQPFASFRQSTVTGIKKKEQQHGCIRLGLFLFRQVETSLLTAMLALGNGAIETFHIFHHAFSPRSTTRVHCREKLFFASSPWEVSIRTQTVSRSGKKGETLATFS